MTLDEAIIKYEQLANFSQWGSGDREHEQEYSQIAEWLKELKDLREYITKELELSCRGVDDLFDENDDRYYLLTKLNSLIAIRDRFPNNRKEQK